LNLKFGLIFLVFFLVGCATKKLDIDYDNLGAQYSIIPETKNKFGAPEIGVRGHIGHGHELGGTTQSEDIFSSNPSSVRIRQDNPESTANIGVGIFGSLGLFSYVDVIVQKSTQGLLQTGLNFCLFKNCSQDEDGLKASLYFAGGYQKEDETTTNEFFFKDDIANEDKFKNVEGTVELSGRTAGLTFGKRQEDKLYYMNLSYSYVEAQSQILIATQAPIAINAKSESYGALLGFRNYAKLKGSSRSFFYSEFGYSIESNRGNKRFDSERIIGSMGLGLAFK
jgi:hypothetical protein